MEEKERYELRTYAGCECYLITDTKEKQQLYVNDAVNLLNKQAKRINELEDLVIEYKNKLYRRLDQVDNLQKETQQLKQQLTNMQNEKDELIGKYRYWRGECVDLKQQLEAKQTTLQEQMDIGQKENGELLGRILKQNKENFDLKQQLHDLPKKIVEEFKNGAISAIELAESSLQAKDEVYKLADTILKKYGGENE